jgi:ATP-binding cassette subfamily B multidrug efflux pump
MSKLGKAFDSELIKRIYKYFSPYKNTFILAVILTVLIAILAPLRPYLIQYTLDEYILQMDGEGLAFMTLLLISSLLVEVLLSYFQTYYTNWLGQNAIKDLRKRVFAHILKLKPKYFDQTPIGTLVTRTISDLEAIAEVLSQGLITIAGDILQIVTIITVMFWLDWRLALISLCTLPLMILATYIFKEKIKSAFSAVRTEVSTLNAFLQEHITGMNVVQIFNREEEEKRKFSEINGRHKKAHVQSVWYYSIFFPVVELISAFSLGLLVWWGARGVITEQFSLGTIISFMLYLNMLFRPMRMLADKFNTLQMGVVAGERVFDVLDTNEVIPNLGKKKLSKITGKITFENVWFAYNDEDGDVLKDINLSIEPGQTLALVGATGAGKSSIINVLSRFYDIKKGSVKIDGIDIRDFEISSLRNHIGIVLQDVFLFSGSIAENITLYNSEISHSEIEAAAKEVGAWGFIQRLPGGLNYNVMERGSTLSTGQAQLISFIRALIYNPEVLVLDEATSSVDTETEILIQNATTKLMKGRTSIVVAHRLSTIQNADKIVVLDKGEVMEMGSHKELLQKDGFYKRLYNLQFESQGLKVG